jgi:hypothetical protein
MTTLLSRPLTTNLRRWLRGPLAWLAWCACALALALAGPARTFAAAGQGKIADDLQQVVAGGGNQGARWTREVNGARQVQVVIVAETTDGDMTALRDAVKAAGGSVHVRMPALRTVTATLPAAQVATLAGRSDVRRVVPNRVT